MLTTYSGVDTAVRRNLQWGIRKGRWGLRKEPVDWTPGSRFEWNVIGAEAKGLRHGPRSQPDEWVTASIDLYIFGVRSELVLESAFYWPDEVASNQLQYPYRFDIELIAQAGGVPTAYDDPIPKAVSEGIRRAASRAESVVDVDDDDWFAFIKAVEHHP